MLLQFGLQRSRSHPPYLPEPVQSVMEKDGHTDAVVYDIGDHLPDQLRKPYAPIFPVPFREEDHGGPGQFRWYYTLT